VNRGTVGVNSLPKTVTRQRHGCCDLNPSHSVPESSTLTAWLPSHPLGSTGYYLRFVCVCVVCRVKVHKRCALAAESVLPCKWTTLASVGDSVASLDNGVSIIHSYHIVYHIISEIYSAPITKRTWTMGALQKSAEC